MKSSCLIFVIFLLHSCNFNRIESGGNLGYSKSIKESKKNGVFISHYQTSGMRIYIPKEVVNIRIKEIFREYKFEVGDNYEVIPLEESQLIISVYNIVPDSYSIKWKIGDYDNVYFTGGKDYFFADLSKALRFDTLKFEISRDRYSDKENEKIGELILIEK